MPCCKPHGSYWKANINRQGTTVPRKYFIETFGCQMNVHDSERLAGLLDQAGYEAAAAPNDAAS